MASGVVVSSVAVGVAVEGSIVEQKKKNKIIIIDKVK